MTTKLTKFNSPLFPLLKDDFISAADTFFNDFWPKFDIPDNNSIKLLSSTGYPKFNINEYEKEYEIEATVPGLEKNEINIELNEDEKILKIKGEKAKKNDKKIIQKQFCHEIKKSKFIRSIILPENSDLENIKTNLKNGILTITIYKTNGIKDNKKIKNINID
jgi:HSP20 family protein